MSNTATAVDDRDDMDYGDVSGFVDFDVLDEIPTLSLSLVEKIGAHEGFRTPDLCLRRQGLKCE